MDYFKTVYKLLHILEKNMDAEEFNIECISDEQLGVSRPAWCRIMKMIAEKGYVSGISIQYGLGSDYPNIKLIHPQLTLEGLEYLSENSTMKKEANLAKGIKEIIPGL